MATWQNIADRDTNDPNASSDINQLMENINALKGGVEGNTPTTTVESLKNDKLDPISSPTVDRLVQVISGGDIGQTNIDKGDVTQWFDASGLPAAANEILLSVNASVKYVKPSGKSISTDGTLSANSDNKVPTEKAVKTYVDASMAAVNLPVGYVYIQFPGDSDPATLGLAGTWTNVSSELAGDFIRFEGGNASTFNSGQQLDAMQKVTGSLGDGSTGDGLVGNLVTQSGALSFANQRTLTFAGASSVLINDITFDNSNSTSPNPAKTDDNETRAVNRTVRKWRRTA
jgi:hypothetical protein